jgi:hypothetical protein
MSRLIQTASKPHITFVCSNIRKFSKTAQRLKLFFLIFNHVLYDQHPHLSNAGHAWGRQTQIQRSRHLRLKSHHPLTTQRPLSMPRLLEPAYQLPNIPWLPHPGLSRNARLPGCQVAGTITIGHRGVEVGGGRDRGKGRCIRTPKSSFTA